MLLGLGISKLRYFLAKFGKEFAAKNKNARKFLPGALSYKRKYTTRVKFSAPLNSARVNKTVLPAFTRRFEYVKHCLT